MAGADCLLFAGAPHPRPLKLLMMVGSDSPYGDSPFGHSAIEPYRVVNPAKGMARYGITTAAVKVHEIDPRREAELLAWPDIITYIRAFPKSVAIHAQTLDRAHKAGKVLVQDFDDWFVLPPDHTSRPYYESVVRPLAEACLPTYDLVTCATETLATYIQPYNRRTVVLPNTIDPENWVADPRTRKVKGLTVGVQGGNTHYRDWQILPEIWSEIARRYPEVTFVVAGAVPNYLEKDAVPFGDRLVHLPYVPLRLFPQSVAEIDIACCPLLDSNWARCKSPIKWMESAILGKAVVASFTVYGDYDCIRQSTVLAKHDPTEMFSANLWVEGISGLIESEFYRKTLGAAVYHRVRENFSIDALAARWASAFRSIFEERR